MSRHAWKKALLHSGCTFDVDESDVTPFGLCCGREAIRICLARHGGPSFQQCGEARCRKHLGKRERPRTGKAPR
jgi:hypothetical protein